jgi:2-polyprenyl-3-methyl-5-hydroxy-6-metoxy-1,4-benzoquinol methylase
LVNKNVMNTTAAYYAQPRLDVLRHVPRSAARILDVGCGAGALGAGIKQRQRATVVGVEYVAAQAVQAACVLDAVHVGDVQTLELPYAPGTFDCLIYADVLEHVVNPWMVLARHRALLAEGGTLIVSLPNVQFIGVIAGLLRGMWNYRARGVLDRTHLRFFTRRTAHALIEQAGYQVTALHRNYRWFDAPHPWVHRTARLAGLLPWVRDLFTYQFVFVAGPVPSP